MNNSHLNYLMNDSGWSSQISNNSSDNESFSLPTSVRNKNNGKNTTYRRNGTKSRNIYSNVRYPRIRPSSRSGIQSRMLDHFSIVGGGRDPDGFVRRKRDEDCLKCMLRIPHKKCESHKYIRVGGGYRHSYYYVRMLLERIELNRQREEMLRRRLEAISEGNTRAFKTYIRTKSGRLIEKIIYLSEEDYLAFKDAIERGEDPTKLFEKYLSKNELENLESYDKDEQIGIKTYIRTKSGRLEEKIIYISKKDFDAIQRGELDGDALLRKKLGLKNGEKLEGWKESQLRTITTKIRTKSGRIIEKKIVISEEDYKLLQAGGNLDDILQKYMKNEPGSKVVGWEKPQKPGMKVVKTFIRTKSGRLIEKTILMTEEEYKNFQNSKGDPNFLKKYLNLEEGETIEKWEKGSTVYEGSDDEELAKAKPGKKYVDKDGNEYEVVVDPLTGKKYKKLLKEDNNAIVYRTKDGRIITEKDIQKRKNYKEGKRNPDSDSEYSYKSFVSAGGTRHVKRKKKNLDGTYGDSESYHSSQDEDGKARRRNRRRKLKHGPNSAHSYTSVVSAGGTRHVRRRKKNPDGTYGDSESYHSDDSAVFKDAEKSIQKQKKKLKEKQNNDSDSDHSYFSVESAGGTKRKMKRKRIRDEHGNIVGYGKEVEHDGKGKIIDSKNKKKRRDHDSDSEFSYFSEVSVGGTHYKKRKKKIRDKQGKVIGYGKEEDYSSDSEESFITISDGKGGKIKVANPKKKARKYSRVFSDATTDSDVVRERMKNMTEEEKQQYLAERAKRAEEREQKRKEKYGDKYESMKKIYDKKKELYKNRKPSVQFSDATTDSDVVRERMKNMTEEEKQQYLAERAKRAEEREQKRKEKYGEKYDEMKKKYDKKKEQTKAEKANAKELLNKKGKMFAKDGNEADVESDGEGKNTGKRRKTVNRPGSVSSSVELIRDEEGRIIKKIKRNKDGTIEETEYDKDGKVISRKIKTKNQTNDDDDDDDGDYFEIGPDGKIRLKQGKTKIDLKNLSKEDLIKLGIDPNLSKAEQLRLLKEMFGENIDVVYGKKKIGVKNAEDYGSDANTTDLAEDSDIDIDTVKPDQRVKIILKRGGKPLQDHMKSVVEKSFLEIFQSNDEKNSKVNFLSTYRLVDPNNLEKYARFFAVEDHDDMDGIINYKGCRTAIMNLKRTQVINNLTEKQTDYIMLALDIDKHTEITFRMFSVISALADRVTKLDSYCRDLLEISDLIDIERKLKFYRDLFNMNDRSDRDPNYIKVESIWIDLKAGGLNDDQQDFVISKLQPNELLEISFLDFLSYIPLFISYHDNIVHNPLDSSSNKYSYNNKRKASIQRDMNPLGYNLSRRTDFYKKHNDIQRASFRGTPQNDDLIKLNIVGKSKEKLSKYPILPKINFST